MAINSDNAKPDNNKQRMLFIAFLILIAALSRLLPHPPNFTPIAAMALFGGAYLTNKRLAILIPVAAMLLSDIFIGFHNNMIAVYLSFLIVVAIGMYVRSSVKPKNILIASVASSVLFFLITNFSVWMGSTVYPQDIMGLTLCYEAGIPFFRNSFTGDIVFNAVLFGSFYFAEKRIPLLAESK